ncbi:MAG: hypothetical protein ACR2FX_05960 [Chthoniobacterales bacterium]
MKTRYETTSPSGRDQFIAGAPRQFPQFSSNFHADARGASFPVSSPAELRRFRRLSGDFFGKETSRDYLKEFTLFSIIVAISAWPIVTMLRALGTLLR